MVPRASPRALCSCHPGPEALNDASEQVRAALRARLARLDERIAAETAQPSDRAMRAAAWLTTAAGVALVALSVLPVITADGLRIVARGTGLLLMGLGGGLSALRGGPLREAHSERRRVAARLADPAASYGSSADPAEGSGGSDP